MTSAEHQGLLPPPTQAVPSPPDAAAGAVFPAPARPPETDAATDLPGTDEALGLSGSDRHFLLLSGAVILLLAGVHWARLSGWGAREIEILRLPERRYEFQIDINRGTWVEWMQLEGIGEITARRIVEDRAQHGPFQSVEDLTRVSGIGPKTLETMRPWLICPDCGSSP